MKASRIVNFVVFALLVSTCWADQTLQLDMNKTYCHSYGTTATWYGWWSGGTCTNNYEVQDRFSWLNQYYPICDHAYVDHNQPAADSSLECEPRLNCRIQDYPVWTITADSACNRTSNDADAVYVCE